MQPPPDAPDEVIEVAVALRGHEDPYALDEAAQMTLAAWRICGDVDGDAQTALAGSHVFGLGRRKSRLEHRPVDLLADADVDRGGVDAEQVRLVGGSVPAKLLEPDRTRALALDRRRDGLALGGRVRHRR